MDRSRASLEVYDVPGIFRQAAVSFKASLRLLLVLALLSSVYETVIERSAVLSGFSLSNQNSNFSFHFSLDPKNQAAHSSHDAVGLKKLDTADSLLSRLLSAFLPPMEDHDAEHAGHEEPTGNVEKPKHADGLSSLSRSQDHDDGQGAHQADSMEYPSSAARSQPLDQTVGLRDPLSDNKREDDEDDEREDDEEGTEEHSHEGMRQELNQMDHLQGVLKRSHMEFVSDDQVEDDTDYLPRLKIETVSNETKRVKQGSAIDALDSTFFTGKILGGRGRERGAMPHGGLTVLLLFLLIAVAVTVFFAIVGFLHASVLGSVAYSVISTHMGKRASMMQAMKSSLKSSIGRLIWLAILHATLQGLNSLFFMKTLFIGVMEIEQVESLLLRLSGAPFAFLAPFMDADAASLGMAIRIGLFIGFDYLFDLVSYCIYMVACWVTVMERNHWGLGAVKRSYSLVKTMEVQAMVIRLIESTIFGRTSHWLVQQVIGQFAASLLFCIGHMFFLVLWLIFYMSARSLHDQSSEFSHRTLEDFLDRFK